jgi:acyl carrier protein
MKPEQFSTLFRSALELSPGAALDMNAKLADFPTWDSLSIVSLASMADLDYGVVLLADQIHQCKTVNDLLQLMQKSAK